MDLQLLLLRIFQVIVEKAYITYDIKRCLKLIHNRVVVSDQLFLYLPNTLLGAWPLPSLPPLQMMLCPVPKVSLPHLLILDVFV